MQSWEEDCPLQIHYVAPSFWAWKGGERKLKNLSNFLDHVLCILPFEEEVLRRHGLAATFVGHPTLEDNSLLKSVPIPIHTFTFFDYVSLYYFTRSACFFILISRVIFLFAIKEKI